MSEQLLLDFGTAPAVPTLREFRAGKHVLRVNECFDPRTRTCAARLGAPASSRSSGRPWPRSTTGSRRSGDCRRNGPPTCLAE
jgi:hypothetical protein